MHLFYHLLPRPSPDSSGDPEPWSPASRQLLELPPPPSTSPSFPTATLGCRCLRFTPPSLSGCPLWMKVVLLPSLQQPLLLFEAQLSCPCSLRRPPPPPPRVQGDSAASVLPEGELPLISWYSVPARCMLTPIPVTAPWVR
ncbi:hypothetical protein HJG60_011409 [Phyllostomus discolor]|uniref:Uncharacterized protein n=1 Tax=Phyllostomus discolor TaxID=89673 RepID=A0A834E5H6_9CHIR|nr:hypothetical protein HJG60_011409 [Phyllostomus discolor]